MEEDRYDVDTTEFKSGRWSVGEHQLFLQGLKKHGRNWKLIQGLIKSRTATQVRTHAQKFFTRDNYQATKRGRYASRLKEIESPDIMEWLRSSGALAPKPCEKLEPDVRRTKRLKESKLLICTSQPHDPEVFIKEETGSEWHQSHVEPLAFFSDPSSPEQPVKEIPEPPRRKKDCLDWLSNSAESPVMRYYGSSNEDKSDSESAS